SDPAGGDPALDHLPDRGDAPLADRPGDHPRLAEAAAPGAAAEDLHAEPLVHRLGDRHDRPGRVLPLVEVYNSVLGDRERRLRPVRGDAPDPPVRQVVDVVEAWNVHPAVSG